MQRRQSKNVEIQEFVNYTFPALQKMVLVFQV